MTNYGILLVLPVILSTLLTYIGDQMYEIYGNIVTVKESTLMQVNGASEAHFAPTSNPAFEC